MASNVIPFVRPSANGQPAYAPGVAPFNPSNAAHVSAWNALYSFGQVEARK
ncbi:hypothetical protein [uncultured Sphingomonas sp.]|uniref:hypothetical protein n=1 Tax=uncultured Sphingomonas sp. TaxID=158754 RepID=UPI00261CCB37|nr:hypothetical protein [uncultured Sphingomonas sp.]